MKLFSPRLGGCLAASCLAFSLHAPSSVLAGNSIYNSAVLADNPLGFWSFDEASGTSALDSATTAGAPQQGAQNGSYINCTLAQSSAALNLGTCARLNGTNSYVSFPYVSFFDLGTGDFSVELWYNTLGTVRGDIFNFKSGASDFGIFANVNAVGSIGGWHNAALASYTTPGINNWYHVVYVRTAGNITLYVNGVSRGSTADTSSMSPGSATPILIGQNAGGQWFNGYVDEVAYYPSALSPARVTAHYTAASQLAPGAPAVTTGTASSIVFNGATISGNLTTVGTPDPTVTLYWGPTNGGISAASWANAVPLGTRSATGSFSTNLTGLNPATTYYFNARGVNTSGESWGAPATFITSAGAPAVANLAAANLTAFSAQLGAQVTATNGAVPTVTVFYGTTDGGTTAGSWVNSVSLGSQSGSATATVSGLAQGTNYFFRARAVNTAGTTWAASSGTFTTPVSATPTVANDAVTDVTGFSATLRGHVTSTGNDPPSVKIYYGTTDGGTTPASWTSNVSLSGVYSDAFANATGGLAGNTTYFYRSFVQNAAGSSWAPASNTFTTGAFTAAGVVINEIHYHPVEKASFNVDGTPVLNLSEDVHEFVELYNAGAAPQLLTGCKLTGGIDYSFPNGTSIAPGAYLVIAKNPARLMAVYSGLTGVLGPYASTLSNNADSVRLRNPAGDAIDQVSYGSTFPWPTGADAMGADEDFTLLSSAAYQYKGRSLQRISANGTSSDPANWLASPIGASPTPGAANAVVKAVAPPIPISYSALQVSDEASIIRAAQSVRVTIGVSSTAGLTNPQLEYFVDDVNSFSELHSTIGMTEVGVGQYTAVLPGQVDRSVVRYRIMGNLGNGLVQIGPRTDDARIVPINTTVREAWWSYFVTPSRTSVNPIYDLFVSDNGQPVDDTIGGNVYPFTGLNGIQNMAYNATGNPKRATAANSSGVPRDLPFVAATDRVWNGSVPAIFIENGQVRDIHFRLHGSRYNRRPMRTTYKLRFADTQKYQQADSQFITDKSDYFSVMHGLYVKANLPVSGVRWIDWYLNGNAKAVKLEQGEYNGDLLDIFHDRQAKLNPGQPKEASGEFYKNVGIIPVAEEGPYSTGDGRLLAAGGPWTTVQRYEWTYLLQSNGWVGATPIKDFFEGMWSARGDNVVSPNPNIPNLRAYFDTVMDVDTELTSMAILNWSCPWDDTSQNHYFWRRANNRWAHFPWDFDGMFGNGDNTGSGSSIYLGEHGLAAVFPGNNSRGPNFFKDSFIKAYRTEYNNRMWLLNNTYLSPDNLKNLYFTTATGAQQSYYSFINGVKANFCEERFASVNTQTGHAANGSDFLRPAKPVNATPVNGATALPPVALSASAYSHSSGNTVGGNAHAKSKWEIRLSSGNYFEPTYTFTSSANLTSLPIPFDELSFGQTYFWRVTYTDASEHPSITSDETSFVYGPQNVNQTLITFGDTWKYNNNTAFTDNTWAQPAFNDAAWSSGNGVFIQSGEPVTAPGTAGTVVAAPGTLSPAGRAYLFRKHFNFPANPMASTIRIRHYVDDGCVIWINGQKVHRYFFNEQANYTTAEFDSAGGGPGEAVYQYADAVTNTTTWAYIDPRPFMVQGDNVIAIQVHQNNASSTDVVMGLEMTATLPATGGEIVLNEIMADNGGVVTNGGKNPDWIELKNNSVSAVDISGWGLTDDILIPTRYTFPSGTTVPANGYLTVWCDSDLAAPGLHTGFGLSAGGQRVVLTNVGALKDHVSFGPQARNLTIGRVPNGSGNFALATPTLLAANTAVATLGSNTTLKVNEWMASPAHGEDWFELYNPDANPVSIAGLWLSDTPSTPLITQIPALSFIGGKGHAIFTADGSNSGDNHANFKLAAGGERLVITSSSGTTTIDNLAFGNQVLNVSQGRLPDGGATQVAFPYTSSKGASNWLRSASVIINEGLSNSVSPLTDYIELKNISAAPVDVTGWWLSDDQSAHQKYQIPSGSIIAPGSTLTIYEPSFNLGATAFSLGSTGDEIILSATSGGLETGYRDQVSFGAAADNVSFGNVETSTKPEFWAQTAMTANAPNAAPLIAPIIINEIHYHPTDLAAADNLRDEFIELHNVTTSAVSIAGWKLKSATDFVFPGGTSIRPGDYILVVGFNPTTETASLAAFRSALGVPATTTILGPFSVKLPNDEDSVELAFPGTPILGVTPFIIADKVAYTDFTPWPTSADGGGMSLQRKLRTVIGNDPSNWMAALPTPGLVNNAQSPILDNDGDGIPNTWETTYNLDPFNSADGALDPDGDGQSNLSEFIASTSPTNPSDVLTATMQGAPGSGNSTISFTAKAGVTYTIQYSSDLTGGSWLKLADVPAGAERAVVIPDPTATTRRFYKLVTPLQP